MIPLFGRPVPEIAMVNNEVLDFIHEQYGHKLTQWNNAILNPVALQMYADAVARVGAVLPNCFGFVDGTVRPICRPNVNQRIVYN